MKPKTCSGLRFVAVLPALFSINVSAMVWQVDRHEDAADANVGDMLCVATSGGCTLRAAIQEANVLPGFDEVRIPVGDYELTLRGPAAEDLSASGDLDIREPLLLYGQATLDRPPDFGHIQIRGSSDLNATSNERLLDIDTGDTEVPVRIEQVLIQFGVSHDAFGGGGALVREGSVAVFERSVLYANFADRRGGALAVYGRAELVQSHVFDNHRSGDDFPGEGGGGIYLAANARLRLHEVGLDSNSHCRGGGILADGPSTIDIARSTIRDSWTPNLAGCITSDPHGDQIALRGAVQLNISDSTLSGGRVIFANDGAKITLNHVTLQHRSRANTFALEGKTTRMTMANSIVGRGSSTGNVCTAPAGAVRSLGGNVFERVAPCDLEVDAGDRIANPMDLVPHTLSVPMPGSPFEEREVFVPSISSMVIDAGLDSHCTTHDQAGASRPYPGPAGQPARCDAGAIEWPLARLHGDGFEAH